MSNGVFNIAKGRVAYYSSLPGTNDALVYVLLQSTGLDADSTLVDFDDLEALLAANNECNATNYARKSVTSATITVDDTNDRVDIDIADQTWTDLGGASNNTIAKLLICYDPDTTGGDDGDIIPLTHHDLSLTTDGSDVTVQIDAAGFFRAS